MLKMNMSHEHLLDSLSDDELLRRLTALMDQHRQVESEVVAHIAEVDEPLLESSELRPVGSPAEG